MLQAPFSHLWDISPLLGGRCPEGADEGGLFAQSALTPTPLPQAGEGMLQAPFSHLWEKVPRRGG